MNHFLNDWIMSINRGGETLWQYSSQIFVQSSILIVLLLIIDFLLRKRIRATLRYWMWMLVFMKLILPPTLCLPTGIGYWFGSRLTSAPVASDEPPAASIPEPTTIATTEIPMLPVDGPPIASPETISESVEPTAPAAAHITPPKWKRIVLLLWLGGISAFNILLLRRIRFVRRLMTQSTSAEGNLLKMLNQCRADLGITRDIQLKLSSSTPSPAACGLIKPIILMPENLPDRLSPERLRAILIHELAHIKRCDLWVNSAQTLLQVIYFYNPLLWLANAVVRRVREQAVDEMVLVALGAEARSYSNTLIDIAEMAFFKPSLSLRLIGVVESKKALQNRIKHMLTRPMPKSAKVGVFGLLAVMSMAVVFLPMAAAKNRGRKTDDRDKNQYAAKLPNGVTVELLGVCEHPTASTQWWRPDGSIVTGKGFGDFKFNNPYYVTGDKEHTKVIALKFGGSNLADIKLAWNIKSLRSSFFFDYEEQNGKKLKPIQAIIAKFPQQVQSEDLAIRVATGGWKFAVQAPGGKEAHTNDSITDKSVIFHEPTDKNGNLRLSVTHLLGNDYDCRIMVYDDKDRLHEPVKRSNTGSDMRQCTGYFDGISRERIKYVRLQARPYTKVTFKNVSLRPGLETNVKIEVDTDQQSSEERSGLYDNDTKVLQMLEAQRDALGARIDDYQRKIHQLEQEYGGMKTLEERQKMMLQRVAGLLERLTEHEARRMELEAQMKKCSKELPPESDKLDDLRSDLEQAREFEKRLSERIDKEDIETVRIGRMMLELRDLENGLARNKEIYGAIINRVQGLQNQQKDSAFDSIESDDTKIATPHPVEESATDKSKAYIILEANVFTVKTTLSPVSEFLAGRLGVDTPMAELTDAQADKFRQWASSIPGTDMATFPRSIVQDGLSSKMDFTTQTQYQLTYRKEADSPPKHEPKIKTGVEIEFRPKLRKDNGLITLGLTIAKSNTLNTLAVEEKNNESGGDVQLPAIIRKKIDKVVTIPVGKYSIINLAGVTYSLPSGVSIQSANSNEQTILLVKPAVHGLGNQ